MSEPKEVPAKGVISDVVGQVPNLLKLVSDVNNIVKVCAGMVNDLKVLYTARQRMGEFDSAALEALNNNDTAQIEKLMAEQSDRVGPAKHRKPGK
jgi:hypothetical protein